MTRESEEYFSPRKATKRRVMRSAAPLSIKHWPMIAAMAIAMPMRPTTPPKRSPTSLMISVRVTCGARRPMTIAAEISATKALIFRRMISRKTTAMATSSIPSGGMAALFGYASAVFLLADKATRNRTSYTGWGGVRQFVGQDLRAARIGSAARPSLTTISGLAHGQRAMAGCYRSSPARPCRIWNGFLSSRSIRHQVCVSQPCRSSTDHAVPMWLSVKMRFRSFQA